MLTDPCQAHLSPSMTIGVNRRRLSDEETGDRDANADSEYGSQVGLSKA